MSNKKSLEFEDRTEDGEKIYVGFYLDAKQLEIFMGGDCHTENFVLSKGQISKLIKFLQRIEVDSDT